MRQFGLMTLWAFHHVGYGKLPVRPPFGTAGSGMSPFRQRHLIFLSRLSESFRSGRLQPPTYLPGKGPGLAIPPGLSRSVYCSSFPVINLDQDFLFNNPFNWSHRGSTLSLTQPHLDRFRSVPQVGQSPLQFSEQSGLKGSESIMDSRTRLSISK